MNKSLFLDKPFIKRTKLFDWGNVSKFVFFNIFFCRNTVFKSLFVSSGTMDVWVSRTNFLEDWKVRINTFRSFSSFSGLLFITLLSYWTRNLSQNQDKVLKVWMGINSISVIFFKWRKQPCCFASLLNSLYFKAQLNVIDNYSSLIYFELL